MFWQAREGTTNPYVNMPTPSSYKIDWEDLDVNSYRSTINGNLIRHPLKKHWTKISFTYSFITEANLRYVLEMVNKENLWIKVKSPAFGINGWRELQGYVSKISCEMLEGQLGYALTFNFVQSKAVSGQ